MLPFWRRSLDSRQRPGFADSSKEITLPTYENAVRWQGQSDDRFSHRVTEPGTYDYMCPVDPSMCGTIIVTG